MQVVCRSLPELEYHLFLSIPSHTVEALDFKPKVESANNTLKHSLYPNFPSQIFLESSANAGNPLELSKNMEVAESDGQLLPS